VSGVPLRVLVDTDVLWGAARRKVIALAALEERLLEPFWSPHIIGELYHGLTLNRILKSGWPLSVDARHALTRNAETAMDRLASAFSLVDSSQPHSSWPNPKDVDDQHLFVAAKRCNAELVISENQRDFPPRTRSGKHVYEDVEYITYAELLTRLHRTQEEILARAHPRSGFFEYQTSLVERFDRYPAHGEKVVVDSDVLHDPEKRNAIISATKERLIVPFWSPKIIGKLFHLSALERFEHLQLVRSSDRLLDVIEQKVLSQESKELMHLLTLHFFLANPLPSDNTHSQGVDRSDDSLLDTAKFCGATTIVSERVEIFATLVNGKRIRDGIEFLTYQELCVRIGAG
jgi:PIN domain